ncbi:MAG: 30S ribosomal protein S6 [Alphaproteobacteria bacterium]
MPYYESTFITRQEYSQQDVSKLTESLSDIVAQGGGKVVKSEYWGLKNFAYRINKQRKGHYTMLAIDAPPAAVHEMERNIRINEDVLRMLTIRVDELEEGPSAQMQQARGRDEVSNDDEPRHSVADESGSDSSDENEE